MTVWIYMIFFFIVVAVCCGLGDGKSSSQSKTNNRASTGTSYRRNNYAPSFSECPSCGAPFFDGYCEECGYPDVNQGWLGENY